MQTRKDAPPDKPRRRRSDAAPIQLLPNLLTLAAICAGMTSIRFAIQGNYAFAVQLVLVAGILDGLDGRLARLLKVDSKIGAELDSLADFLNFGVAPPFILYLWGLQDIPKFAWIAVLFYTICCVIRLARFNVDNVTEDSTRKTGSFVGVPSPAGAVLAMLPIYLSLAVDNAPQLPGVVVCFHLGIIGLLMISAIPTPSFKSARLSRRAVKYYLVGAIVLGASILTFTWSALIALTFAYLIAVVWSALRAQKASGK